MRRTFSFSARSASYSAFTLASIEALNSSDKAQRALFPPPRDLRPSDKNLLGCGGVGRVWAGAIGMAF